MSIRTTVDAALLLFALSACDTGPYDPAAHSQADVGTGSRLSGVDTDVTPNGAGDASIRVNTPGSGAYGGH